MPRERQEPAPDHLTTALAQLERSVTTIQDSETFRAYLVAQARFHQYSWGNVLLILAQKPDATRVAGYRAWQSLGRQVKRGEQAIRIIAPATVRNRPAVQEHEQEQEDAPDEPARRRTVFRAASVFDISQTEGDPLPEVPVPVLDSQAGGKLYTDLERLALTEGLRVTIGHPSFFTRPQLMGFYAREQRAIYVREAAQLQQTKTLAHELAHHLAEHQVSGPASETEAEAVAYVVLAHYGLDAGARAFPYIATWARDPHVLKAALATIQRVSSAIIAKLADGPALSAR